MRPSSNPSASPAHAAHPGPTPAYFDAQGQPVAVTKMSTVGTASATASYYSDNDDDDDDGHTTTVDGEDILSLAGREVGSVVSHDAPSHHAAEIASHEGDSRSDDGDAASLVGFGEGAGSTISGPTYRPPPSSQPAARHGVERTSSGLSERGSETPVSSGALQERRAARMTNGVAVDEGDEGFVDTTTREPVLVSPPRRGRKA